MTGKINIGYISSGFANDVIENFINEILSHHNTQKFNVCLFSTRNTALIPQSDKYTIFNIENQDPYDIAKFIFSKHIHLLIDLNGYTEKNNMDILAYKPGFIQMTYIGYPNSLNVDFVKYRITDSIADHPDSIQPYSEQLIKLPKCFLLYKNTMNVQPYSYVPKSSNEIILGSMNKENKNSPILLQVWKKIMESTGKNVKFLVKINSFDSTNERIEYYMKALNIDKSRLVIIKRCSNEEYTKLIQSMDILMDTFPYSGTTTSCNALYNSTPVITLYNKDYHAHNVTSSLLINSGFPELVAHSTNEYIEKTLELIQSPDRLAYYKQTIAHRFKELMNPAAFMVDYEEALCKIYDTEISTENKMNPLDD